jgi:hypothetical protein
MNEKNTTAEALQGESTDQMAEEASEHIIQIASANLPSGEPVVVLMTGATVSVLPLQLAQDVADGLIKAIAGSTLADSMIPTVSGSAQREGEPVLIAPAATPIIQTTSVNYPTDVNKEAMHG